MTDESEARPLTPAQRRYGHDPRAVAEGEARAEAYYSALSRFVDVFAHVEECLFYVLTWQTKTRHEIAKAILSDARANLASDHLRRLATVGIIDTTEWAQLEPVLGQLKLISDVRNSILHHGTQGITDPRPLSVNGLRALTTDRMKIYPAGPDTLEDIIADCRKIVLHLMLRHAGRPALRGNHPDFDEALVAAWRYRPPLQSLPRSKGRNHQPGRGRSPGNRTQPQRPPSASQK
jgi:hypothetical protein